MTEKRPGAGFGPQAPSSAPPAQEKKDALPFSERMAQAPRLKRLTLVNENPGVGQLTISELSSLDPQSADGRDFASAAIIIALSNSNLSKGAFVESLAGDEETVQNMPRAQATVDRMIEAEILEERGGVIVSNLDLFARRG